MDYQHFQCDSKEFAQNNLDYLILNIIHLVIKIHCSMLNRYFEFIVTK